jgi:hypothetical protein
MEKKLQSCNKLNGNIQINSVKNIMQIKNNKNI